MASQGLSSWLSGPKAEAADGSEPPPQDKGKAASDSPLDISLAQLRAKETITSISPEKRSQVEEIDSEADDAEFDERAHWARRGSRKKARATRRAARAADKSQPSIALFCVKEAAPASEKLEAEAEADAVASAIAASQLEQGEKKESKSKSRGSNQKKKKAQSSGLEANSAVDSSKKDEAVMSSGRPKRQAVVRAEILQQQQKLLDAVAARNNAASFLTPPPSTKKKAGEGSATTSGRKRKLDMNKKKSSPPAKGAPPASSPGSTKAAQSFFLSEQEKKQLQEIEAVSSFRTPTCQTSCATPTVYTDSRARVLYWWPLNPRPIRAVALVNQKISLEAAMAFKPLLQLLIVVLVLVTASLTPTHAASATRVVVPDIAGMIYPLSAVSSHVQFGDPTSSSPSAYEFVAPTEDSVVCTDARLCLKLRISSEFLLDPFFLSRYDTNTPLVSATFDGYDSNDILPLIPGTTGDNAEATVWWFQTNSSAADVGASVTSSPPVIDLLLRLRQRSQRLSARDQLLVQLRIEMVDSSTTTSAVQAYGVYGNQLVKQSTRRVDSNVVQVDLAITKNSEKRDVDLSDAYPLLENSTWENTTDFGASCDDCLAFLDSCGDIEVCNTEVMPCLLSKLEVMASGGADTGSYSGSQGVNAGDIGSYSGSDAMKEVEAGSFDDNGGESGAYDVDAWYADFLSGSGSKSLGESATASYSASGSSGVDSGSEDSSGSTGALGSDSTNQIDLLWPLASCVADLPAAVWFPIRQAIFCVARSKCALGRVLGNAAGEEYPTTITMTNGSLKFHATPAISGTNNVNLTIVTKDIRSGVTNQQTFEYMASASYLGMFLRAFVLNQAADVSVLVEPSATDPSALEVSLTYFNALMLRSVDFYTTVGNLSVIDESPARAFIDYAASSSRPNLDIILEELRVRVNPSDDTWILSLDCLSCSTQLFGCSAYEITRKLCNYNSMKSAFGQCIRQQVPPALFEGIMKGSFSSRPISNELYRCLPEGSSTTNADALGLLSALSCFAETRCPFGPIALVQKTQAVVLETTSYIQLLRISPRSSTVPSILISFNLGELLVGSTEPINSTWSELEIEAVIKEAVGLDVSVSSLSGNGEWTLEIIYHNVFLPADSFVVVAAVDDTSVESATIKQVIMEGGEAQLRTVPRNKSTIFMQSEIEPIGPSGTLLSDDACRKCAPAMKRCQDSLVCSSFSREILVPSLYSIDITQAKVLSDSPGGKTYEFDLVPTLQATLPESFDAWDALAAELYCFADVKCDLEYEGVVEASTGNHLPIYLSLDSIFVNLSVRTYPDTQWTATTQNHKFMYTPGSDVVSAVAAADAFLGWVEITINETLPEATVLHLGNWTVESTGAAVGVIAIYGQFDELINRYVMAPLSGLPSFSTISTNAPNLPAAGINTTPWSLSLTSVGSKPQYSKFLDLLLGYGIAGTTASTPTPASTIASLSHEMGSNDKCRRCGSILAECQNDAACVSFSQYSVIPLLQDAQLAITTEILNDYGAASFRADLYPILLPLSSSVNNTPAAWDLVAAELYCLAYDTCKVEYSDVCVSFRGTDSCPGVDMDLARSSVDVRLLTYADTEWDMTINGNVYSYIPDETGLEIEDEAQRLQAWFEALNDDESLPLEIQVIQQEADSDTRSATFNIRFLGTYIDELYQYAIVNPTMIPSFAVAAGTTDGSVGSAQGYVTLPELVVYSDLLKPQYSKLINLLSHGIAGATTSSAPSPTPTSASTTISADDPCRQNCQHAIDSCRADADCLTFQTSLASLLGSTSMELSVRPQNDYGAARVALNMSSVLNSSVSAPSGTAPPREHWDAFALEIACFNATSNCDLEYDDVVSPFSGSHVMTSLTIEDVSASVSIRSLFPVAVQRYRQAERVDQGGTRRIPVLPDCRAESPADGLRVR
ncbi:hypothetical protein ON010_g7815 [Phytophthora cinnamomi]|nr:hypothetical protein ON010_g7815 [Phytophthora cinnamomi]